MSSQVVRQAFQSELVAAFPAVPYFTTLAVRTDNEALPALWQSLDFIPASDGPISIGNPACYRETGAARALVVGQAGAGEGAAITQAEASRNHFRRWAVPAEQIQVVNVLPPTAAPESDGRWLVVAVDMNYRRDYFA